MEKYRDMGDGTLVELSLIGEGGAFDELVERYEDAVLDSDDTMEIARNLDFRPDFRLFMYKGYGHAAYDTAPDYRKRIYEFMRKKQ